MKKLIVLSVFAFGAAISGAFANVGAACSAAAENGDIELPAGMSVSEATALCQCLGESATGDVAAEFMESLAIYDLDERMSSLSDEATEVFGACAA